MKVVEFVNGLRKELLELQEKAEVEAHVRILLEYYLGYNRAQIQLNGQETIKPEKLAKLQAAVEQLKSKRPLDYIIEESVFLGYPFYVNESVLIPRSETEELVMMVASEEQDLEISILDIGTGSGCIPIGLAKEKNYRQIDGCEVSEAALEVARINAQKLKVEVGLFQLDILNSIPAQKYEVVVSNPPYVLKEEIEGLDAQVKEYEPIIALTPEGGPLLFYKRMIQLADQLLNEGGRFYWEIHEDLGEEVCTLFKGKPFKKVQLHQDMYGRDRFVTAVFSP
ncbi:MAG: peptide chain release factor N(5)-glutamine methyltransferase [Vicingaceae bacterium]